jgi:hypothetical protein
MIPFDSYTFHLDSYEISRWVIYLCFAKQGSLLQKFTTESRQVFKKVKCAHPFISNAAFSNSRVHGNRSRLGALACQSFQAGWSIFKRVKPWRWFQGCFYFFG